MGRTTLLVAVTAIAAALFACRGWDSDKPPVHLNWNMDTQEKGKAYRRSDMFADGRMMRPPVEGTVARGHLNEDDEYFLGVTADGQMLGPKVLPAAVKSDANLIARGKDRYGIYCAPCHGATAKGEGPVGKPGRLLVPPPSFFEPRMISMPTGQLYRAMHKGVNNDNMPSYAAQIPVEDRWAIVAYICMLQGGKDPTQPCIDRKEPPKPCPKDKVGADCGEAIHAGHGGCIACHSTDGTAKVGPTFKGLWGKSENTDKGPVIVDEAYIIESIQNPTAKIVTGFAPTMPARTDLTEPELKSLVEFIKSLK